MEAKIFTTLSADDLLSIIKGCIKDALTLKTQEKSFKRGS